jgi:hypothetical protein
MPGCPAGALDLVILHAVCRTMTFLKLTLIAVSRPWLLRELESRRNRWALIETTSNPWLKHAEPAGVNIQNRCICPFEGFLGENIGRRFGRTLARVPTSASDDLRLLTRSVSFRTAFRRF